MSVLSKKKKKLLPHRRVMSIFLVLVDLFFLKDCYKTHDSSWETLLLLWSHQYYRHWLCPNTPPIAYVEH